MYFLLDALYWMEEILTCCKYAEILRLRMNVEVGQMLFLYPLKFIHIHILFC